MPRTMSLTTLIVNSLGSTTDSLDSCKRPYGSVELRALSQVCAGNDWNDASADPLVMLDEALAVDRHSGHGIV